jgi:hypothetical protein
MQWGPRTSRRAGLMLGVALLALVAAVPPAHASDKDKEDYDAYKLRFGLFWFYSKPTGSFTSKGDTGLLDLEKDIGFNSYSTFDGKVDWKFTRKNHLYFIATDFDQMKTVTLNRTVVFQGQTFAVGSTATATGELHALVLIPGYQYDFIRHKRWNLGAQVQLDICGRWRSPQHAKSVRTGNPIQSASSLTELGMTVWLKRNAVLTQPFRPW